MLIIGFGHNINLQLCWCYKKNLTILCRPVGVITRCAREVKIKYGYKGQLSALDDTDVF